MEGTHNISTSHDIATYRLNPPRGRYSESVDVVVLIFVLHMYNFALCKKLSFLLLYFFWHIHINDFCVFAYIFFGIFFAHSYAISSSFVQFSLEQRGSKRQNCKPCP